jgi:hypothetical protein
MDKKGFVWFLFKKELMFFWIGIIVGIILTILTITGAIPIPYNICQMYTPVV